ncbi:ubiquinone/menaquinone biosynthesis methyltransferase [bacterium]|nr:ubiquinone/menaquinone biosynthesis methyltransferase [bacterium]
MSHPFADLKSRSFNRKERQKYVAKLFDGLAPKYDRFNRWVTFHRDETWRRKTVESLGEQGRGVVLDLAAGTGDLAGHALTAGAQFAHVFDISLEMLILAQTKLGKNTGVAAYELASANAIPFRDACMDGIVSGFAMRNVFHFLDEVLEEMYRVLKPGGRFAILELSKPTNAILKFGFDLHMKTIMPLIGRLTTGHAAPFKYLYQTAMTFLSPQAFQKRLARVGFRDVEFKQYLLGGIAIHTGQKSG